MNALSEIMKLHQSGKTEEARNKCEDLIVSLKPSENAIWELDQAYGIREILHGSATCEFSINDEAASLRERQFQYWSRSYCFQQCQILIGLLNDDHPEAAQRAHKIIALSGLIGSHDSFLADLVTALNAHAERRVHQTKAMGSGNAEH